MNDNPSFVLVKNETTVFEERPVPVITDNDVLVEVKKTGICGTDIHFLRHCRAGNLVVEKPMVLGHESSGVVYQVGSNIKHLKPGDRVALDVSQTCRSCEYCKHGKANLCPDLAFASMPPHDGTLGRYYSLPADLVYKLPDNLTLEDGAVVEPLAVSVYSVYELAQFRTNQSIAVFGCGPIGLLCMATAKAIGARRIIAVDIDEERLQFAKEYAATDCFLPPSVPEGELNGAYSQRGAGLMMDVLGIEPRGEQAIDLVIDATGAEVCIQMALHLLKPGGTLVQVGMGAADVTVPMSLVIAKELTILGCIHYGPRSYPLSISLVAQGKIDLKPLVTHRFAFKDAAAAFAATRAGKSPDGKSVIKSIISGPDVDPADP